MTKNWKKEAARLGYWCRRMKKTTHLLTRDFNLIYQLHVNDKQVYFTAGKIQGINEVQKELDLTHNKCLEHVKKLESVKQVRDAVKKVLEDTKQELNEVKSENERISQENIDTKEEIKELEEFGLQLMEKIERLEYENEKIREKLNRSPEEVNTSVEIDTPIAFRSIFEYFKTQDTELKTQARKSEKGKPKVSAKKQKKRSKDDIKTKELNIIRQRDKEH